MAIWHTIQVGDMKAVFHKSGFLRELSYGDIMLNQFVQSPLERRMSQLYLRIKKVDEYLICPLLSHEATVRFGENWVRYTGETKNVHYEVVFRLHEEGFFYEVSVDGDLEGDIIYLQDIGLALAGAIRTNEAFNAQYLDYFIGENKSIAIRQNQPQNGAFPFMEIGSMQPVKAFSTDGFQFFHLEERTGHDPRFLQQDTLADEKYQYELAMTALQTETWKNSGHFIFYGFVAANQPEAVKATLPREKIQSVWKKIVASEDKAIETIKLAYLPNYSPLAGEQLTASELEALYPERHFEEFADDKLLAFFTGSHAHVVLPEKERHLERPHSGILTDPVDILHPENTLATTSQMDGIFNSQLILGNTNLNKLLSHVREPLNLLHMSGQRIYVKKNGEWHLLTMPSAWEIGANYSKWYYKTEDDLIEIKNFLVTNGKQVQLEWTSSKNYPIRVTNQIVMGDNEYETSFEVVQTSPDTLEFSAAPEQLSKKIYPELGYRMTWSGASATVHDESIFGEDFAGTTSLQILDFSETNSLQLHISAKLEGEYAAPQNTTLEAEKEKMNRFMQDLLNGFNISHPALAVDKWNATLYWYTQNMLVHFGSPHGLEQHSGAAWGTRDVCQGPFEFFLATSNQPAMRHIIEVVFSKQYQQTGDWPQWFMFDRYSDLKQEESHGDVIVWPLKIVGDYLAATGDTEILDIEIPYAEGGSATLLEHVELEIKMIESRFIAGTYLSNYGNGDWDDTLQPANQQQKKYMSSSWTVALTYQVIRNLGDVLPNGVYYKELAEKIKTSFNDYIFTDGNKVIPGFLYLEDIEHPEFMVHPTDKKTNIDYRLLPLTRSIIAELVDADQALIHDEIIDEHLLHPDGVRLMSQPATYTGGVSRHFLRAEQASFFGREVGLQYVHAHIRFVEALAKRGKTEAFHMLDIINPIGIGEQVKNAELRQSNAYFSSSDAAFKDRYEAQNDFAKIKRGEVKVKGGWRIYSSGPGIFIHQLLSAVLGLRETADFIEFDPVLPADMDGLTLTYRLAGKPCKITYRHTGSRDVTADGHSVISQTSANLYREGALCVKKQDLASINQLEIHY
ncbi:GH36-type glycosyl hydrolase domain-containing protein [Listeria ilorinensis]|uniref:GH36-type glycosyl hydrolase domain-containing protein n=1 Tax=Listeria ilorinensis TaxID=2867439 RepID=UPI001EF6AB24|nr:cellobiose phosphorylase [Listeria ilorinensis]